MSGKTTAEQVVTWVAGCIPNADQVKWIEINRPERPNEVRFEWRKRIFRVNVETLFVEEVEGHMLVGSDEAALIEALLKKQCTSKA